jgi:hypothetical protein
MNKIEIDLKQLPPDVREWVQYEIDVSNANDIAVHLLNKKHVIMDRIRVSGYFCSDTDKLVVSGLAKDWVQLMVHESCHRDQYIENISIWNTKMDVNGEKHDPLNLFWDWLNHEIELTPRKLREAMLHCMNIELDCEIRSAKKINEFYLPINTKEYIQKANAYVYLYHVIPHVRKWYQKGMAPFNLPEVWTKMPTNFDRDYTRIPKKIKDLIINNCFK